MQLDKTTYGQASKRYKQNKRLSGQEIIFHPAEASDKQIYTF